LGVGLGLFGVAAGVGVLVAHVVSGRLDAAVDNFVIHTAASAIVLGLIASAAVRRTPSNVGVWALVLVVACQAVEVAAWAYVALFAPETGPGSFDAVVFGAATPMVMQTDVAVALWLANWIWVPGLAGWLTFGLMWFPNGELAGPRWRLLPWVAGLGIGLVSLSAAIAYWPTSDIPYLVLEQGLEGGLRPPMLIGAALLGVAAVATLLSLVARYRTAGPDVREGLKWMLFGSVLLAALLIFLLPIGAEATAYGGLFVLPVLFGCYGIAILRYRAFDIDLIISRTLVYGALAAFITGVYVAIVVGVDLIISGGDGAANPLVSLAAITVVAITVQPLRRRLTQFANRLVFGRRSTPYEVLSEFSRRVAAADEHLLETVARSLVEGTPASAASVWVEEAGELHPAAVWPEGAVTAGTAVGIEEGLAALPGAGRVFPVFHGDDPMGAIGLTMPPGAELAPPDVRLAEQVAGGMGLALRNLSLTERLRHRVEELQESRRRIVKVRDETRRRLERDLHDGAQQRLVALRVRLGLVGRLVEKQGPEGLGEALAGISDEAQSAIDALRDFARGVYPPLLEAEGLVAALTAQARRAPLPVTVEGSVGRHDREVEAAVYFSVLEALQNVAKHAGAHEARVLLSEDDGSLRFEVVDDGGGFSGGAEGSGVRNMRDRIDAIDGSLSIESALGRGTTVSGRVPSGNRVPA
jgi:signal transduction histidine kinase